MSLYVTISFYLFANFNIVQSKLNNRHKKEKPIKQIN